MNPDALAPVGPCALPPRRGTRSSAPARYSIPAPCEARMQHPTPTPPTPPRFQPPLHLSDLVGGILKALTGAGDAMDGRRQVHAVHLVHILGGYGEDLHRKVARPTSRSD